MFCLDLSVSYMCVFSCENGPNCVFVIYKQIIPIETFTNISNRNIYKFCHSRSSCPFQVWAKVEYYTTEGASV